MLTLGEIRRQSRFSEIIGGDFEDWATGRSLVLGGDAFAKHAPGGNRIVSIRLHPHQEDPHRPIRARRARINQEDAGGPMLMVNRFSYSYINTPHRRFSEYHFRGHRLSLYRDLALGEERQAGPEADVPTPPPLVADVSNLSDSRPKHTFALGAAQGAQAQLPLKRMKGGNDSVRIAALFGVDTSRAINVLKIDPHIRNFADFALFSFGGIANFTWILFARGYISYGYYVRVVITEI